MNSFRFYKSKRNKNNHKTKNSFRSNDRYKKGTLQSKEIKKNLGSATTTQNRMSLNIDKLKTKYGFLSNNLSQKLAYNKIQMLKNKYFKNNNSYNYNYNYNNNINYSSNSNFNINSIDQFSINLNDNLNNLNRSPVRNLDKKKNIFRNSSLKFVKENNIIFNNFYNTLINKKNNTLYKHRNNNSILIEKKNNYKTIQEVNKTNIINNIAKLKMNNKFKYLKNNREDFIILDKKLKELFKNDAFNKNKKKSFNTIFPISKKINMLSEVKKDIKNLNKKSFEDNLLSSKVSGSFLSNQSSNYLGIHSERKTNLFYELFDKKENDNLINNENVIIRPNLIKSLPKPKLEVPNYVNFCSI